MIRFKKNKTKYYRITSNEVFNFSRGNFYRILKVIGHYNNGSNKYCIKFALDLVRKEVRSKGYNCTNTEIRNLIQAKHLILCREAKSNDKLIVYKLSQKADLILKSILELFEIIKNDINFDHTKFYRKQIKKGEFCRMQMIYAIDEKLNYILESAPTKHKKEVSILRDQIKEIRIKC